MLLSVQLFESHQDISTAISHIWSLEKKTPKKNLSNQANPLPSSSKLSVFVVPLGNSECITEIVEVRRSRTGKSKGKNDLSSQKSIWWISAAELWESSRYFSKRGEKVPEKNQANSVDARSSKWRQWDSDFLPPARHFLQSYTWAQFIFYV